MTNEDKDIFIEKLEKLNELGSASSAHNILGWYGTFQRVKRFYSLYQKETDGNIKLDYGLAFFIFSYHLREWIPLYEQLDRTIYEQRWNSFLSNYPEIKISRDICNVSKHFILEKESADKNFRLFWEFNPFMGRYEWIIIYNNQKESLLELMRKVLNAWGDFIVDYLKLGIEYK